MKQKTEASQAVDELLPCPLCASQPTLLIRAIACDCCLCELGRSKGQSDADLAMEWNQRAALKAQPAPTEGMPKLVIALPDYEQRKLVIASDEMIDGERVVCAAIKSAPTEAAQDALSANPNLTTSGVTCQPVAAQGNTSNNSSSSQLSGNSGELQPSGNTGELAQGWDVDDLISDMDINEEVAGMRAELQASSTIIPSILAAQGEDSARLDWLIENVSSGSIGFINGDFIGSQDFDELKVYIDRARASAETGGVKP